MWVFEAVYKQHFQAVFRLALRQTGRREWAEDVTSETFLALYRHREEVHAEQLPAWLFAVARNRAIDLWRRKSKEDELDVADMIQENAESPAGSVLLTQLLDHKSLKPVHRVCLVMRFVQGMSREEIAQEMGWKESQVKGYLQYALKLLRKDMERG